MTRLRLSVTTLRRILVLGIPSVVLGVFIVVSAASQLVLALVPEVATSSQLAIGAIVFTSLVSIGAVYSDSLGSRKDIVRNSPNRGLFQAMNIFPSEVYLVYVLIWRLPLYLTCAAASLAVYLAIENGDMWAYLALLSAPFALSSIHIGITTILLAFPTRSRFRLGNWVPGAGLVLGLGAVVGLLFRTQTPNGQNLTFSEPLYRLLVVVYISVLLLGIVLSCVAQKRMNHVGYWSGLSYRELGAQRGKQRVKVSVQGAVRQGWRHDPGRTTVTRICAVFILCGGFYIVAFGIDPLVRFDALVVHRIVVSVNILATLAICDVFLARNGLVAQIAKARFFWELGLDLRKLIWAHVGPIFPYVILLASVSGLAGALGAGPSTMFVGFLGAFGAAGASVIADAAIAGVRNGDGSMTTSAITSLLTMLLTVPVFGLLLIDTIATSLVAALVAALFWGGAFVCLRLQILRRPSDLVT